MSTLLELTENLIKCASVTPDDAGCQEILINRLQKRGFKIEYHPFGEVKNFWAQHGTAEPLFLFVGHTDVVPPGPLEEWQTPPFKPMTHNGFLYGRGAADMKGSLAAMMIACEKFIDENPNHPGSIAWLITSDEEGASVDGVAKVAEVLKKRGQKIKWCLIGEPTSEKKLGDIIKNGRRGSLSGNLIVHGKQGHIAYPQEADNPIHKIAPALQELTQMVWDKGNAHFPATSFQISNIHAGTGASNVIPGILNIQFNFRYSPESTAEYLQNAVEKILQKHHVHYTLHWHHSGMPFLTTADELINACSKTIEMITGVTPQLSTHGGTSDARFIAPLGAEIVEFGPRNNTIHQVNECVAIEDLETLARIYEALLKQLFC